MRNLKDNHPRNLYCVQTAGVFLIVVRVLSQMIWLLRSLLFRFFFINDEADAAAVFLRFLFIRYRLVLRRAL